MTYIQFSTLPVEQPLKMKVAPFSMLALSLAGFVLACPQNDHGCGKANVGKTACGCDKNKVSSIAFSVLRFLLKQDAY